MRRFGLIGRPLGHSASAKYFTEKFRKEGLSDCEYALYELPSVEELPSLLAAMPELCGLNVTIPYKRSVMHLLDRIAPEAQAIGAVNCIRRLRNGTLEGHNTDFAGFTCLLRRNGISLRGKTVMLLGTGGTQKTVLAVARAEGAAQAVLVSRRRAGNAITYEEAARRADVQVIVNTSPVGMYPNNGECLVALENYPRLEAVLDVIYNPFRTALLQQAEARGLPAVNGMLMLVAQAKYAAEHFLGRPLPDAEIDRIDRELRGKLSNLVLVGMPGSGKSSLGKACAKLLGKRFVDMDDVLVERIGGPISSILSPGNETPFRNLESAVAAELGKENGQVIATGGGAVLRAQNVRALRQNGVVVYIDRPLGQLAVGGARPLSQSAEALAAMHAARAPLYAAACDARVENDGPFESVAEAIKERFYEILDH